MEFNIGGYHFGILGPKAKVEGRVYIGMEGKKFRFIGIHIFPRFDTKVAELAKEERWGLTKSWYDGPIYSFGLGPFAMIIWG